MQAQPQLDAEYSDLILKVVSDKKELECLESELLNLLKNNKGVKKSRSLKLQLIKLLAFGY